MLRSSALFLLAWALAFTALPLAARAGDEDLLGDLDMAMAQEEVKASADEDQSFAAQVMRNLDLSLRLRGTQHLGTVPRDSSVENQDDENTYGEVKLDFGSSYEQDGTILTVGGWVETGSQYDTYLDQAGVWTSTNRRRKMLEINELYLTTPLSGINLTLGKRTIKNKISTIFSPADRYGSFDLNDPLDMRRYGTWQATLEDSTPELSWMLAFLPTFEMSKPPSQYSRWLAGSSSDSVIETFYGSSSTDAWSSLGVVSATSEDREPDQPALFAQAKSTIKDWDLLFSAFRGPSTYPVLQTKIDRSTPLVTRVETIKEHPMVSQAAAGFSTTWKDLEFHGEGLYSLTDQGKDDDYVQYVGGLRWSSEETARRFGMQRVTLGLEYAGEALIKAQSAANYSNSSRELRLGRNDLIAGMTLQLSDDWDFHCITDLDLEHNAHLNRFGFGWKMTEKLSGDLSAEFFDGPKHSYFGYWKRQDRLVTTLTYKIH